MNTPTRPRSFGTFVRAGAVTYRSAGAVDAASFLRKDDRMAALLPAVTRMLALQKDCARILPAMFNACDIVQFESGQLVLSTPNAAVAARLKQQLPKLQDGLIKLGWQVSAIRLKVQVGKTPEKSRTHKSLELPARAVSAFAALEGALEDIPSNQALRDAIAAMVARRR
ncbi:MAG TPA: hypothetical protein VIT92_12435 [Burkholderiaceae bacterium]